MTTTTKQLVHLATWTIVLRGGNQATVNLLQGIVSRGMQWERA